MTRSKYGARKTTIDNIVFDSMAEARRYHELKIMERAGLIRALDVHPVFPLDVNGVLVAKYEADFAYQRGEDPLTAEAVVEDVKGMRSGPAWSMFRLKSKLYAALYRREVEVYPPAPPRAPRKAKP